MKINNPETRVSPAIANPARTQVGDARSAEPAVIGVDASAKVRLSDAATTLIASGERAPAFDAEKVARIAKAIASGTYSVNAGAVADKLIQNTRDLLSKAN